MQLGTVRIAQALGDEEHVARTANDAHLAEHGVGPSTRSRDEARDDVFAQCTELTPCRFAALARKDWRYLESKAF